MNLSSCRLSRALSGCFLALPTLKVVRLLMGDLWLREVHSLTARQARQPAPLLASIFPTLAHGPCFGNHRLPSRAGVLGESLSSVFFWIFLVILMAEGEPWLGRPAGLCYFPDSTVDFFLLLSIQYAVCLHLATQWLALTFHTACPFTSCLKLPFSRSLVGRWPWEYLPTAGVASMWETSLLRSAYGLPGCPALRHWEMVFE